MRNRRTARHVYRAALRAVLFAAAGLVVGSVAAAPIDVPDPRAFARLPAVQQEAIRDDLHRRMMEATPQERSQYRAGLRAAIERLSPDERREIAEYTRRRWEEMSPQDRERAARQRRERARLMSAEERKEALEQRRQLLEALSVDERAVLQQRLPEK